MIKRSDIYLGVRYEQGVVTPLIGKYEGKKIKNLENGELLEQTGQVYGAIDGFPTCSLNSILEEWNFGDELNEEALKIIVTIFKNPSLVKFELNRINQNKIDPYDSFVIESLYLLCLNSNQEKKLEQIMQTREQLFTLRQQLVKKLKSGKVKKK